MKNLSSIIVLTMMGAIAFSSFQPSSTSTVSFVGGVIKSRNSVDLEKKYPRKDCPVCKGKGWYISGDGIEKVDCGYCEPEKKEEPTESNTEQDPPLVPIEPKHFILRK